MFVMASNSNTQDNLVYKHPMGKSPYPLYPNPHPPAKQRIHSEALVPYPISRHAPPIRAASGLNPTRYDNTIRN